MRRIIGLVLALILLMPVFPAIHIDAGSAAEILRTRITHMKERAFCRSSEFAGHFSAALERIRAVIGRQVAIGIYGAPARVHIARETYPPRVFGGGDTS